MTSAPTIAENATVAAIPGEVVVTRVTEWLSGVDDYAATELNEETGAIDDGLAEFARDDVRALLSLIEAQQARVAEAKRANEHLQSNNSSMAEGWTKLIARAEAAEALASSARRQTLEEAEEAANGIERPYRHQGC